MVKHVPRHRGFTEKQVEAIREALELLWGKKDAYRMLAKEIGYSESAVRSWLAPKYKIKPEEVRRIPDGLVIDIEFLLMTREKQIRQHLKKMQKTFIG